MTHNELCYSIYILHSVTWEDRRIMIEKDFLIKMDEKIQAIKKAALELKEISGGIQAIDRNADRILTSAKMLEINVSDALDIV